MDNFFYLSILYQLRLDALLSKNHNHCFPTYGLLEAVKSSQFKVLIIGFTINHGIFSLVFFPQQEVDEMCQRV